MELPVMDFHPSTLVLNKFQTGYKQESTEYKMNEHVNIKTKSEQLELIYPYLNI